MHLSKEAWVLGYPCLLTLLELGSLKVFFFGLVWFWNPDLLRADSVALTPLLSPSSFLQNYHNNLLVASPLASFLAFPVCIM